MIRDKKKAKVFLIKNNLLFKVRKIILQSITNKEVQIYIVFIVLIVLFYSFTTNTRQKKKENIFSFILFLKYLFWQKYTIRTSEEVEEKLTTIFVFQN